MRDGLSVERAADMLWVLCAFETVDLLLTDRGLGVEETIEVIVNMA